MPRTVSRTAVLAALGALVACGPIEYLNQVSRKAANAVRQAEEAGAEQYAPYEYHAAVEYLHKAREEAGYSDFEPAIAYGRKAEDFARRARKIAEDRRSGGPDGPPSAGLDAPAPAAAPAAMSPPGGRGGMMPRRAAGTGRR